MIANKTLLRAEVKAKLSRLTEEERRNASLRIRNRLLGLPELKEVRVVLLYASLPREVETDQFAEDLRDLGISVTYPRCLPGTREMTLHAVASAGELAIAGPYGIREPSDGCEIVGIREVDLVMMPGLAWDREGHRLGRGAGYYDRLLAASEWRGVRCGVFFAAQEVSAVPNDEWDVPMDLVVTENETARFAIL